MKRKPTPTASPATIITAALTKWVLFNVVAGVLLRAALLCHPLTQASSLSFGQWVGLFALGAVNDLCFSVLAAIPIVCFWLASGHWRFCRPQVWYFLGALVLLWLWVTLACPQLWEFNKSLARVVSWVIAGWGATFALRAFMPGLRQWWMRVFTALILFIYVGIALMNVVGEWTFWNEFGVRYNFIAVDYLVYTSEVIGNIMQSYSMGWIITAVVIATAIVEAALFAGTIKASGTFSQRGWRPRVGLTYAGAAALSAIVLPLTEKLQHTDSVWYNELQANGACSFVRAFTGNELAYQDFYYTCPPGEIGELTAPFMAIDTVSAPVITPNIVLVTMESLSGDYLAHFGNKEGLTPSIDSLWSRSAAFEHLFAAGNRTVRGLEALILSRPPSPGESIIKRPDNTGYPSVADKLGDMGYDMTFYYGGNSYFDNMESFFTGLGYQIRDRKTMSDSDISCQTVWGVCDGDIYRRVIADLDSAASSGTPQFAHVLTTSNHRPYIYPDGCVSIPPSRQSREGAVMYSDYALGQFISQARTRPWFDNTVFVVVADHCASSAGSTELPVENYHIPALIYSPALIEPLSIDKVASQIDVLPTLFAMLGWEPSADLYGRDVLSDGYRQRAFLATYQDMGMLSADTLTVLSPGRKYRQFAVNPTAINPYATTRVDEPAMHHVNVAAAHYQLSQK